MILLERETETEVESKRRDGEKKKIFYNGIIACLLMERASRVEKTTDTRNERCYSNILESKRGWNLVCK